MFTPISTTPTILRRLLLGKQLYIHGLGHSHLPGALNKIVAINNFHNAIEIVLRSLVIDYSIPPDDLRHESFEVVLAGVEKYFRPLGQGLPYFVDLKKLNQHRNHAQHDAVEPVDAVMETFRVITRNFLERTFDRYYSLEYGNLSPVDLINDPDLRLCLQWARDGLTESDFARGLALSRAVFVLAQASIEEQLPKSDTGPMTHDFIMAGYDFLRDERQLKGLLEKIVIRIDKRIDEVTQFTTLLASGVSLPDYVRFQTAWPKTQMIDGQVMILLFPGQTVDPETAQWIFDFVVNTMIAWQGINIVPGVPRWWQKEIKDFIAKGGPVIYPQGTTPNQASKNE